MRAGVNPPPPWPGFPEEGGQSGAWSWETYANTVADNQQVLLVTNSFTELQTGLHYWDGQWVESSEVIEPFPQGAVARKGQFQMVFSPRLNVPGAIDLLTSAGDRLRSTPVGLAYLDAATGKAVLIAVIKDSLGELLPPNQVLYADSFSNVLADVRYTYRKSGMEQDIILRENPPSPKEFGLDPATTRLEIWTEFVEAPAPQVETRLLSQTPYSPSGQRMTEPDLVDEILDFKAMKTGSGTAFALYTAKMDTDAPLIPVAKRWQQADGRTFLVESVSFSAIQPHLEALPPAQAVQEAAWRPKAGKGLALPAVHARAGAPAPMRVARPEVRMAMNAGNPVASRGLKSSAPNAVPPASQGFVLDYQLLISAANQTFKGDTTYYVSGTVNLSGTTILEGGAVIKYTNQNSARINITVPWIAGPRPTARRYSPRRTITRWGKPCPTPRVRPQATTPTRRFIWIPTPPA